MKGYEAGISVKKYRLGNRTVRDSEKQSKTTTFQALDNTTIIKLCIKKRRR